MIDQDLHVGRNQVCVFMLFIRAGKFTRYINLRHTYPIRGIPIPRRKRRMAIQSLFAHIPWTRKTLNTVAINASQMQDYVELTQYGC